MITLFLRFTPVILQPNAKNNEPQLVPPPKIIKQVRFNLQHQFYFEPTNKKELLKKARISDHYQCQADKTRMERMLAPIFTSAHREKIMYVLKKKKKLLNSKNYNLPFTQDPTLINNQRRTTTITTTTGNKYIKNRRYINKNKIS